MKFQHAVFVFAGISTSSIFATPPIPEPGAIFYGRVTASGSETAFAISSLTWSVTEPGTGRVVQLSLGNGIQTVSHNSETWFIARFPFATNSVPGVSFDPLPADTFALSATPLSYDRTAVTANGMAATLKSASGTFQLPGDLLAGAEHSRLERIDLSISSSNQALYDTWISQYFPLADMRSRADADPDNDGINNLMERALGLNPSKPSVTPVSKGTIMIGGKDYFTYTYRQPLNLPDAPLTPQISKDLRTWQEGPAAIVEVSNVIDGNSRLITVRDTAPTAGSKQAYIRLKASAVRP